MRTTCFLCIMVLCLNLCKGQINLVDWKEKAYFFHLARQHDSAVYYGNRIAEHLLAADKLGAYLENELVLAHYLNESGQTQSGLSKIQAVLKHQGIAENEMLQFEARISLAEALMSSFQVDNVERLLNEALDFYESSQLKDAAVKMAEYHKVRGDYLGLTGRYRMAREEYKASLVLFDSLAINNPEHAGTLVVKAFVEHRLQMPDAAFESLKRSIEMKSAFFKSENHPDLIVDFSQMGDLYSSLNLENQAIVYLERALNISESLPLAWQNQTSNVLRRLANSYQRAGDTDRSLNLKLRNLNYLKRKHGPESREVGEAYYEMGTYYGREGQFGLAVDYYGKAESIYVRLANQAIALNMIKAYKGFNLLKSGRRAQGQLHINQSISFLSDKLASQPYRLVILYENLAYAYDYVNMPDSSLKYFHRITQLSVPTFNDPNPLVNPDLISVGDFRELLPSLFNKARALEDIYERDRDDQYLYAAIESLRLADTVATRMSRQPSFFRDKLFYRNMNFEKNFLTIRLFHRLYQQADSVKHMEDAFLFSEKNKSSLLLSNLQRNVALQQANIPDSIVSKLVSIEQTMDSLSSYRQKLRSSQKLDSPEGAELENQWLRVRESHRKLLDQLAEAYPKYHEAVYTTQFVTIENIRAGLKPEELFVSYHVGNRALHAFLVAKDSIEWKKIDVDSSLTIDLNRYSQLLSKPDRDTKSFAKLSAKLGKLLLPGSDWLEQYNALIIVPDNFLTKLPFETLLVSDSEANKYAELPYLLKTHTVTYAYSATLLNRQKQSIRDSSQGDVLAFAPVFDEDKLSAPDIVRSDLKALTWTRFEVENIKKYFKTTSFLGEVATESKFREKVPHYSVVHVASHGLLSKEDPMYSRLVFSPNKQDSLHDDLLYIQELFNLEIPADMVVLSACNTGIGEVNPGEGMISLASGFFYAGARSLVMTLWTANDKSSAQVMDLFYEQLSISEPKGKALRNAKLSYLRQADGLFSHPYYWAHFVVNGNDQPLHLEKARYSYSWLVILVLAVLGLMYFSLRKKLGHS